MGNPYRHPISTPVPELQGIASIASRSSEPATADVGREALEARDTAQSAVEAWAEVFEGIEAHLQDRIAMQDEANPATYLSIIRSSVANVLRASVQIRAARWADYNRQSWRIAELEAQVAALSRAAPSSEAYTIAGVSFDPVTGLRIPTPSSGHAMAEGERLAEATAIIAGMVRLSEMGLEQSLHEPEEDGNYAAFTRAKRFLATTPPTTNDAIPAGMAILPPEVAAHILKIGRVEWGQTHAHDADGHGEHIARSVRLTAEAFAQEGDQHMHGLWLEGTETVVAHTGTSPNAPATTQALVGMWNWFYDQAALSATPSAPATEAGDEA